MYQLCDRPTYIWGRCGQRSRCGVKSWHRITGTGSVIFNPKHVCGWRTVWFSKTVCVVKLSVCICVRETSQMALGAVCAAAFVNHKRVSDWKSSLFALTVRCLRHITAYRIIDAMLSTNVKRSDFQKLFTFAIVTQPELAQTQTCFGLKITP